MDESPESNQVEQQFYRNEQDAISAVNAVYEALHNDGGQTLYNSLIQIGVEMAADDYAAGPRARNAHVRAIANLSHDASNDRMEQLWKQSYQAINRANIAIDRIADIDSTNITGSIRKRLINEAKFLRALNYFNLVRWFGRIPIVLHETTNLSNESLDVFQSDEDSVYLQIIKDLKDSEELPAPSEYASSDVGRATSGAAKSLLAKVYLTHKDWNLAATKSKEVIDTGWYSLFDNYEDVFNVETKNGKEHIFSVQFKGNSNYVGNGLASRSAPYEVPGINGDYCDMINTSSGLYESFDKNDKRLPVTFITKMTSPTDGKEYVLSEPHFYKYYDSNVVGNQSQSSRNFPIIRYSEILLIYAEAINEVNEGPTSDAYAAIDKVRSRAGISKLADIAPNLSEDAFRDSVFQERRKEFVYEYNRWFDLSRRGADYYVKTLKAAGKTNAAPRHIHFPIPQRELDLNPNLKQNPDWVNY
nr:RagB/SusD family nutrient uptake outer membrane protein [Prevotella sp.]